MNQLMFYNRNVKRGRLAPDFRKAHTLEKRTQEASRIVEKYPERIPVICQRKTLDAPEIDRKKYLVPKDLSLANFMYIIRKRVNLPPEKSLYLFINGNMITLTTLMSAIYEEHKDKDGFLYVDYSCESTFG